MRSTFGIPFGSLVVGAVLLSACGGIGGKELNSKTLKRALNTHFENNAECIPVPFAQDQGEYVFITEIPDRSKTLGQQRYDRDILPFLAMEKIGIVSSEETTIEVQFFSQTKQVPAYKFSLTEEGIAYLRPEDKQPDFFSGSEALCYGNRKVSDVSNFTEPNAATGVSISRVNYTYSIDNMAEWATLPELNKRYGNFPLDANQVQKDREDMVMSDKGWIHHSEFK